MVDGFRWARVTSKQLRFLYEAVTLSPTPAHMYDLAAKIDRKLAGNPPAAETPPVAPAGRDKAESDGAT